MKQFCLSETISCETTIYIYSNVFTHTWNEKGTRNTSDDYIDKKNHNCNNNTNKNNEISYNLLLLVLLSW